MFYKLCAHVNTVYLDLHLKLHIFINLQTHDTTIAIFHSHTSYKFFFDVLFLTPFLLLLYGVTAFEKACCPNVASAKYFIGENVSIDSIFTVSLLRIGRTNSLLENLEKFLHYVQKEQRSHMCQRLRSKKGDQKRI